MMGYHVLFNNLSINNSEILVLISLPPDMVPGLSQLNHLFHLDLVHAMYMTIFLVIFNNTIIALVKFQD